jgi:hypothetical protein
VVWAEPDPKERERERERERVGGGAKRGVGRAGPERTGVADAGDAAG